MKSTALPVLLLSLILGVGSALAENSSLTLWGQPTAIFSSGIKIAPGSALYFSSGTTAGQDGGADVKTQALTTIGKLKNLIGTAGFGLGDVVLVRAYLAPGPDGTVDYKGWNAAWNETFNNPDQPHKPNRTSIAVPRLGSPTTLIEIEFVCAAPDKPGMFSSSDKLGLPVSNPNLKPYGSKTGRIYTGMGITAGSALYWTSGTGAGKDGGKDTKTQARTTLAKLKDNLASAGLGFKDVIFLRCFVGPDKAQDGKYDLDGWNAAYDEFFNNTENPHKPARTTVTSPVFNGEGMIEIEVIAAYPAPASSFADDARDAIKEFGEAKAIIAAGVAVNQKSSLYFSSGTAGGSEGDMKTQAVAALENLKGRLGEAGLSFKDVVFLRAYLVPEADGSVDRKGWGEAYQAFFNNDENPHKPARTSITVKSLPSPQLKIEIDIIAATH